MQQEVSVPAGWINGRYGIGLFFAISFVFIYCQIFQLPVTPIYFEGDPMVSVSNAIRILDGQVMYRDFFHFLPPGAELVYAALFSIFGIKVWTLNAMVVILGMAQIGLLWYFGRHVLSGIFVYLPAAIFLVIGFRHFGIDGTYRLYSVICVLLAAAVLMYSRTSVTLIAAGCLCGVSSFFVQPRGVVGMAGIVLFFLWDNYNKGFELKRFVRSTLILSIGFVLTIIITQSYFLWQAGFENYYFSLVTFPKDYYPNDPLAKYSSYMSDLPGIREVFSTYSPLSAVSYYLREPAQYLFYYLLIPCVYFAYLLARRYAKFFPQRATIDRDLMLLCAVGTCLALGVSAPTAMRLYQIAIPGVVVFTWFLSRLPKPSWVAGTMLVLLAVLGSSYLIQRQLVTKYYLDTPAGRTAFLTNSAFERYRWIGEHTEPGDSIFEPWHPSFYFPFHLVNVTPLYLMRETNYTPAFQVEAVVHSVEKSPPLYTVWPSRWNRSAGPPEPGDNLDPLRTFVKENYEYVTTFSTWDVQPVNHQNDVEIWRRRDTVGPMPAQASK